MIPHERQCEPFAQLSPAKTRPWRGSGAARCRKHARILGSGVEDLFRVQEDVKAVKPPTAESPLAARMRPRSLDEFVGQQHILAPGKLLRRAIEADRLPSVIFSDHRNGKPHWPRSLPK